MEIYITAFYLAIPAFIANMAPVVAMRWNFLNYPLDFNLKIRNSRLFGSHKTWRGLFFAIAGATVASLLLWYFDSKGIIEISQLTGDGFLLFGILSGLGAIIGDAIFSFIKRQINIPSGRPFIPFDQIDYIIGFLLFTSWIMNWTWREIIFLLLCGLILNPAVNLTAYFLKIKKTYW